MPKEAGHALLVFQEERFVAGVEIYGLKTARRAIGTNGSHEAQAFRNAFDNALVFGLYAVVAYMAQSPIERGM